MTMNVNDKPSNNYTLSIRYSSDGFSFSVLDENSRLLSSGNVVCDAAKMSEIEIVDSLAKIEEFYTLYKKISLIAESDEFTVLPKVFAGDDKIRVFFEMQHSDIDDETELLRNELPAWNAVLIFAVPKNIFSVLKKTIPEVEIEHHLTAFINDFVPITSDTMVYVLVRKCRTDFVALKNGRLVLLNSYEYKIKEDILYNLLNVYNNLQLDLENHQTVLYVEKTDADFAQLISEYIKRSQIIQI
jgi:hypothetical protein